MKKLYILTIVIVCFSVTSRAQITKGSTFLGGSLYFGSGSSENENSSFYKSESSNWGVRPQFGKAIATNKVVGVFANFGGSGYEQTSGSNTNKDKSTSYGGGIFLRNYYPLSSRFYLFGEGSLGANFTELENRSNTILGRTENTTAISVAITPGISFAAARKLHLEASLNSLLSVAYSFSKSSSYDATGTVTNSAKGRQVNAGVNANGTSGLSVGLRWILPSASN